MERLQKVLAHAGIASRRKCEQLIVDGRVKVNGHVCTELGTQVRADVDKITVDDKVVVLEEKQCILLHKPTSYVTTVTDPEGRRTVLQLVPSSLGRLYPVGRLDYETSGLLLLTNDGDLAQALMHPSHGIEKVYRVTLVGMPEKEELKQLEKGLPLEDGTTAPAEVSVLRNHPLESVIELTIHEGKNRQVRRMFDYLGYTVKRLKRIAYGPLQLDKLPPGKWRPLTKSEWDTLYEGSGVTAPPWPGAAMEVKRKQQRRRSNQTQNKQTKSRGYRGKRRP
ncbi:pseudouridine synthase [Alicyclobacillus sp. SO9]|uniref:pseudouridine synthase n=1 Tax=Alicyclobacillus sp. SO9 TaxID=2665646 RepID=UPI0018E74699|nr:pseudouridine synthase [Alicyclobacillus sp. SO9]QQE76902.1 rRNA pseudouridine synthase [Alicyclobacillus sp. SO9]